MKNASYREYLQNGLLGINENLRLKVYKRLPTDAVEWEEFLFDKKRDVSVRIMWKNRKIHTWLVDRTFFDRRNTNRTDRKYMRLHADVWINAVKEALTKKDKPIGKTNERTR